jgi:hypothetical protein
MIMMWVCGLTSEMASSAPVEARPEDGQPNGVNASLSSSPTKNTGAA